MRVDIHPLDIELNKAIETHIQRKIQMAFSRMEAFINTVSISIVEIDAETEANKHCRIQISGAGLEDIIVEDTQMDIFYVIDRVIQRASRSLNTRLNSNKRVL